MGNNIYILLHTYIILGDEKLKNTKLKSKAGDDLNILFEHQLEEMIRDFEAEHNIEMHIEMTIVSIKKVDED